MYEVHMETCFTLKSVGFGLATTHTATPTHLILHIINSSAQKGRQVWNINAKIRDDDSVPCCVYDRRICRDLVSEYLRECNKIAIGGLAPPSSHPPHLSAHHPPSSHASSQGKAIDTANTTSIKGSNPLPFKIPPPLPSSVPSQLLFHPSLSCSILFNNYIWQVTLLNKFIFWK